MSTAAAGEMLWICRRFSDKFGMNFTWMELLPQGQHAPAHNRLPALVADGAPTLVDVLFAQGYPVQFEEGPRGKRPRAVLRTSFFDNSPGN